MLNANNRLFRAFVCVKPKTRKFLRMVAFLCPDDIPITLLPGASSLKINHHAAISECMKQRILNLKGAGYSIDPDLQDHIRQTLSFAESAFYIRHALHALLNRIPANIAQEPQSWEFLKRLAPQALCVCNFAEQFDLPPDEIATLLCQTALMLLINEQFPQAEMPIRKILQIALSDEKQPNPHAAYWLRQLANVLEKTGRADQAQPLLKQADDIDKNNL